MTRFPLFCGLFVSVTFLMSVTSVVAQAPLDVRVIYERLDSIESRLRDAQSGNQTGMPTLPAEAGTQPQQLPTDVAGRLQVRIFQIERLVEALTGQMEETRFEVSQMRAQVQQMSNDAAYRLAVLEQAAGVSSAVAAPSLGAILPMQQPGQASGIPAPVVAQSGLPARAPASSVLNGSGRVEPDLSMPMSAPVQPQPQILSDAQTQMPQGQTPAGQAPIRQAPLGQAPAGTVVLAPGETLTAPVQAGPVNQGDTFGMIRTDETGNVLPPAPGAEAAATQLPPQQPTLMAPPRIETAPSLGPVTAAPIGAAPDPFAAMTSLPAGTPKEQYDYAFDILRKADYGRAETALRMFLEANPNDMLAGNAQYWLGETYYVRGDFEQAAVEFLSGYQAYPSGNKAPDNLLKLGLSMARLGQTDGACTALSRLATEYPEANDTIRRRAQTERGRLTCS